MDTINLKAIIIALEKQYSQMAGFIGALTN